MLKILAPALSALILFCTPIGAEISFTEIPDQATLPLLTPAATQRKTVKLRLANNLEAYIVSDPNADQSAAALALEVGSWEDPQDVPGMAHLIEHMLFLGTEQFPVESEFDRFITGNGGISNAYTADTETNYMFSVDNRAFPEALERFSSFFKAPLFNPSGLARELQAIDQEYAKNKESDDVRQYFVVKELGNPLHPDHQFSIGNSETLSNVPRDKLKQWHEQHYSANIMHLAIYSPLPLDVLKKMVAENFSDVPNFNKKPVLFHQELASPDSLGKIVHITPLKNRRTLTLFWEIPAPYPRMNDSRPDELASLVLGWEGENSLLAELKQLHWAESLSCGTHKPGPDHEIFCIQIELTPQGLGQIDTVIEKTFQAIAVLQQKEMPRYLFDELQHIQKAAYQFPSLPKAFNVASKMASEMIQEDIKTFPEKTAVIQDFDPKGVQGFAANLTPERSQIYLMAAPKDSGIKADKNETWMQVPYAVKEIPAPIIEKWKQAQVSPGIGLPSRNPFIPEHLALVDKVPIEKLEEGFPIPKTIVDEERGKVYFVQDDYYLTPEVYCSFDIKSPKINNGNPRLAVLNDLYLKSLNESLNKIIYPAQAAGIRQRISRSHDHGISIILTGYSEKAPLLLDEILKQLKSVKPSQEAFETYKETLRREYLNFSKELALERVKEAVKGIIFKDFVSQKEKSSAVKEISYEDFLAFTEDLFTHTYTEGIIYGNIGEMQAQELWRMLDNTLQSHAYTAEERVVQEIVLLPDKSGPYYLEYQTQTPGNATLLAIQHQPFSFQKRAAQQILSQALQEPFYSALRTKQQTGYLVYSWEEELELQLFSFFASQSNTHSPRDLLSRFELSLESFLQEIDSDFPEERFKTIQQSVINSLSQMPENMEKMGKYLHHVAFHYSGDFEWITKRIQATKELTYEECLAYAKEFFGKGNKQRIAILLRGTLPPQNEFHYHHADSLQAIRKLSRYTPRTMPTE